MPIYLMLTNLTDEGRRVVEAKQGRIKEISKENVSSHDGGKPSIWEPVSPSLVKIFYLEFGYWNLNYNHRQRAIIKVIKKTKIRFIYAMK